MNKKWKPLENGLIYSTNPDAMKQEDESIDTPSPKDQKLKVLLDKKQRAGKIVTLITGFKGSNDDLEALCKKLKNHCGAGGSAKDHEIIIQGDHKEKVLKFLLQQEYGAK